MHVMRVSVTRCSVSVYLAIAVWTANIRQMSWNQLKSIIGNEPQHGQILLFFINIT